MPPMPKKNETKTLKGIQLITDDEKLMARNCAFECSLEERNNSTVITLWDLFVIACLHIRHNFTFSFSVYNLSNSWVLKLGLCAIYHRMTIQYLNSFKSKLLRIKLFTSPFFVYFPRTFLVCDW